MILLRSNILKLKTELHDIKKKKKRKKKKKEQSNGYVPVKNQESKR